MGVTNVWQVLKVRSTLFFQGSLEGETVRMPRGRPAQTYHLTAPPRIAFGLTER
ncbi:MAG TPA: hypothetical protein VF705_00965 [Longimicrobium sp.]|jgi:hypothetical protein